MARVRSVLISRRERKKGRERDRGREGGEREDKMVAFVLSQPKEGPGVTLSEQES